MGYGNVTLSYNRIFNVMAKMKDGGDQTSDHFLPSHFAVHCHTVPRALLTSHISSLRRDLREWLHERQVHQCDVEQLGACCSRLLFATRYPLLLGTFSRLLTTSAAQAGRP